MALPSEIAVPHRWAALAWHVLMTAGGDGGGEASCWWSSDAGTLRSSSRHLDFILCIRVTLHISTNIKLAEVQGAGEGKLILYGHHLSVTAVEMLPNVVLKTTP